VEGSPAALDDNVYFGDQDGGFYAVDAALGVERWAVKLDGGVAGTPACAEGRVFVGTQAGTFHALDAASGQPVWTYKAGGPVDGGGCVGRGRVCFPDRSGKVHALDVASGALVWPAPCEVGGPVTAAPILVGDVLYGGTAHGSGYWGIDLEDGVLGWRWAFEDGADLHRQPLYADGRLVFTSRTRAVGRAYRPATVDRLVMAEPMLTVTAAVAAVTLDGRLDDAVWAQATRLPAFVKANGLVSGAWLEVRALAETNALCLGWVCRDADVVAGGVGLEGGLGAGDHLAAFIGDASGTGAVVRVAVSPSGAVEVVRLDGPAEVPGWASGVTAAVTVQGTARAAQDAAADTDTGWTAELRIPAAAVSAGAMLGPLAATINVAWTDFAPKDAQGPRTRWLVGSGGATGPAARRLPVETVPAPAAGR